MERELWLVRSKCGWVRVPEHHKRCFLERGKKIQDVE